MKLESLTYQGGYNQHRCFQTGLGQAWWKRARTWLTPACPLWLHGHSAAPPSLSLLSKGETLELGEHFCTEEHSQKCVPKAAPSQRTDKVNSSKKKKAQGQEFLESPVVRAPCFHFQGWGFIPQLGGKKTARAIPLPRWQAALSQRIYSSSLNSS